MIDPDFPYAGLQAAFARITVSPVFKQFSDQQEAMARALTPAFKQFSDQQEEAMARALTPTLRTAVLGLSGLSARLAMQQIELNKRDDLALENRVRQASRSWALSTRSSNLVTGLREPESLAHLGLAAEAVNTTAYFADAEEDEGVADAEPWQLARAGETDSLLAWLETVNPNLPAKYKGGGHLVGRPSPDWLSQAANSGQELLDWTLRSLAPDNAVLEWRVQQGKYQDELGANGRPHRALRIRYIAASRSLNAASVDGIIKAVTGSSRDLQKIKNASEADMSSALRASLVALEHCLFMLRGPY